MKAPSASLKEFSRVSDRQGWLDLTLHWGALIALFALAHCLYTWWGYLTAALLVGGLQHGLINLQHDAWHVLCFKERKRNDLVGAWFYAYPVGMPYYHDRQRHLEHHKYFASESDPERLVYANAGRETPAKLLIFMLGRLSGSLLTDIIASVLVKKQARIVAREQESSRGRPVMVEYLCVVLCQVLLLAGFLIAGRVWEYFVLWFLPLCTFASFFVSLRGYLEHAHVLDLAPADERLRDFNAPLVERFFISPCDFNYHAVHHAYPTVPHANLRSLRKHLGREKIEYPNRQCAGYLVFWREHLREMRGSRSVSLQ
ncbi:MAG TPA: fatty acid desaturase [Chroococcales cyanobacterium]